MTSTLTTTKATTTVTSTRTATRTSTLTTTSVLTAAITSTWSVTSTVTTLHVTTTTTSTLTAWMTPTVSVTSALATIHAATTTTSTQTATMTATLKATYTLTAAHVTQTKTSTVSQASTPTTTHVAATTKSLQTATSMSTLNVTSTPTKTQVTPTQGPAWVQSMQSMPISASRSETATNGTSPSEAAGTSTMPQTATSVTSMTYVSSSSTTQATFTIPGISVVPSAASFPSSSTSLTTTRRTSGSTSMSSLIVSTTATTTTRTLGVGSDAAVAAAKAAANEAVNAMEALMRKCVVAVLPNIDRGRLEEGAVVQSVIAPGGQIITVAVMSVHGAAANGGRLSVPITNDGGGFAPSTEITASVLESISAGGPVAMAAGVMSNEQVNTLMAATGDDAPIVSGAPPLALSFFDSESRPLSVQHLSEPILIKVSGDASENVECMFWNTSLGNWSGEGLSRQDGKGSELVCSTTHLSLFAGIVKKIGQTLLCSNADSLFSHAAWTNISKVGWYATGASASMWATIFSLVLLLFYTILLDYRDSKRYEHFGNRGSHRRTRLRDSRFVGSFSSDAPEAKDGCCLSCTKSLATTAMELGLMFLEAGVGRFKGFIDAILSAPQAPRKIVETSVDETQSFQLGMNAESVAAIRKFCGDRASHDDATALLRTHKVYCLGKEVAVKKNVQHNGDLAMQTFLGMNFGYRFLSLCAALNPLVQISSLSLFESHLFRAWLFCVRLAGASAANAVFYDMSALPKDMTQELQEKCAQEDSYGWVGNLVVGVVSTLASDGVMFFLMGVRGKPYPELDAFDGDPMTFRKMQQRIAAAQIRGWMFWMVSLGYAGTCLYAILAFNASVSEHDQAQWLLACLWTLCDLLVLECVFGALLMTTLCGLALCYSSDIRNSVRLSRGFSQVYATMTDAARRSMMGVVPAKPEQRSSLASVWSTMETRTVIERVTVQSRSGTGFFSSGQERRSQPTHECAESLEEGQTKNDFVHDSQAMEDERHEQTEPEAECDLESLDGREADRQHCSSSSRVFPLH
eukprot:TRINITY_DN5289_c0_g1_i1.p1 TRINITY_DN5289_c0_g1~~TRINITY_DN5289_c0_g1_i1.p1  ORF type:complete len:1030 (+),score=117.64 TRINITY_DN5289_c0_g1_i1:1-3090(+)